MPFSEVQLTTWANQGATVSSASTYATVKSCIDSINWNDDVSYEIYLQGSYKNTTNIRGNSDVDVVVEFTSSFWSNKNSFDQETLSLYNNYHSDAKYSYQSYKDTVVKALEDRFGKASVTVGNRSICVKGENGRLTCDVICCLSYKEFNSWSVANQNDFVSGIKFLETNTGKEVINFPKRHYDKGAEKNALCAMNYKQVIRIFKNMRARMAADGLITYQLSPSYFVECLLYNMPNTAYNHKEYQKIVLEILKFLHGLDEATMKKFVCQNSMRYLYGSSPQQWDIAQCREFIEKVITYWNKG